MDLKLQLADLGLTAKEAAIYLTVLELGLASVSEIARKAAIKRPTAYNIIETLIQKQLIIRSPERKRMLYRSAPPIKLHETLQQKENVLGSLLPHLQALHQAAPNKPRIIFHEGKNGIYEIYKEIFTTHKIIHGLASFEKIYNVFTEEEIEQLFALLRQNGGMVYDLLEISDEAKRSSRAAYRKGVSKVKFLLPDFKISVDMLVRGDLVALVSLPSLVGVLIENKEIADMQRQLLQFLWKNT